MKILALAILVLAFPVQALEFGAAWSRATPRGAPTAVVFGTFINSEDSAVVVTHVAAAIARSSMIHRTVLADGMTRMRHLDRLELAPGEQVVLKPGGLHIMMMGLSAPLIEGDVFELTIEVDDGSSLRVPVTVGAISQMSSHSAMTHSGMSHTSKMNEE